MMSEFKKFKSKFPSKCKHCSAPMEKGDDAMIAKQDKTWIVICPKCHSEGHGEQYVSSTSYNLEDALEAAKKAELGDNQMTEETPKEPLEETPKKIDVYSLPFEERIKHTAKWILKNE